MNAGTILYGSTYYLLNRLSKDYPSLSSSFVQSVPNFYRDGYVFDGWNTAPDGSSELGYVNRPDTQYGRGALTSFKQLEGSGSGSTVTLYAQWIKREGISGTETLSNGAVITNEDSFGRSSITGTNLTIPYTVSGAAAEAYSVSADAPGFAWAENGKTGHFYYMNEISDPGSALNISGTLSIRLDKRAYDNAGRFYDVLITVSNIVLNPQRFGVYASHPAGSVYIFGYDRSTGIVTASVSGDKIMGASYDISVKILQQGTDTEVSGLKTILYFQDLDSEDTSTMSTLYRYVRNRSGLAPYTEAVTVPLSTSAEFYTKSGENFVIAQAIGNATRITGGEHTGEESAYYGQITPKGRLSRQGIPMSEQEYTAVVFPVSSDSISLSWSGSNCGTSLFASPAAGTLRITKTSSRETLIEGNTSYSLAGAVFGIYADEESAQDAAANGQANGNELAVLTTDSLGETQKSQEMTLGTYYAAELTAPPGFYRDSALRTVQLTQDGEEGQIAFADDPFLDTIGLLLQKTDGDGNPVPEEYAGNLAGAEFTLEYYKEISAQIPALGSPARSWIFRTDDTGAVSLSDPEQKISGDDLYYASDSTVPVFPAGTIVITEKEAPPGFERAKERYVLTIEFEADGTPVHTLYSEDGTPLEENQLLHVNSAADIGLKIKEDVSMIKLTIEKLLYREDLLEEHGEVSFAFEITGTDRIGKTHTYHQMVSFSGEEEGDGSVSRSAVISIPAGTYSIQEGETDRYVLTDITALTDNLNARMEPSGEAVGSIRAISGEAAGTLTEDAAVRFTNRKTDWGGFSHTTSAVNHVGGEA